MRFVKNLPYIATGLLLILHGFAHLPAVLGSWGLATFDDVSYRPNVILENASDLLVHVLGIIWLAAAIAFVIAGVSILRRTRWWAGATLLALSLSMPMTVLWMHDAVIGMVVNLVILTGILVWILYGSGSARQYA